MLLGIDLGTSSLKVAVLDASGATLAQTSAAYRLQTPHAGWCEIDPGRWWEALASAVRALPEALRAGVQGIGLSGQMHGVVLCDADGIALRPAVLWPDRRAIDVISAFPEDTLVRTGNAATPGIAGPILVWLLRHEREVCSRTRWALQPKDWLRLRLTGAVATDASDASGTLLTNRSGQWDIALIESLKLEAQWFAPLLPSHAVAGALTASAAEQLALRAGISVVVGAADTAAAIVGSGFVNPSAAQLTIGTGAQLVVLSPRCPTPTRTLNAYRSADIPRAPKWYTMAAMQNAGLALDWARGILGMSWADAYRSAFADDVRSEGLFFLPYLSGERSPVIAPTAQGAWVGLSLEHTPASLMRAAFNGVALSIRASVDALERAGYTIESLVLAGGGSIDAQWRAVLAQTIAKPIAAVATTNASVRGAALLAGVGIHGWTNEALARMSPEVTPMHRPEVDGAIERDYRRFATLFPALSQWLSSTQ